MLSETPVLQSITVQNLLAEAIEQEEPQAINPPTWLDWADVKDAFYKGETGDAEIFARIYKGSLVYDHSDGTWYSFGDNFWKPNQLGEVYRMVTIGVAAQYLHAAGDAQIAGHDDLAKELTKRAATLRNRARAENVLFFAARPELGVSGSEWDTNPWSFACENGVLELPSPTNFRPGRPEDYIRAHAPVRWEGLETPAPRFEQFIKEIQNNDLEAVGFLRRFLGMCLTGLTYDHKLPICHGPDGRNGKGTLFETIADVMGNDYAGSTQADAIMDLSGYDHGESPKPFVYALRGKRLVWASESNEGRRINVGLVKLLTGGDRITVRTLHSKPVTFKATHKLMLITNKRPKIDPDDQAVWDRICLVPFNVRFVDNPQLPNERKRDKELKEKLLQERSGILAWLVRGCLEWQELGLRPPANINRATEEYRAEEDDLAVFIDECLVQTSNATIRASDLYAEYTAWAAKNNLRYPLNRTSFGLRISKRFEKDRSNGIIYKGVGLRQK